ncbi:HD-GYP domain-containing protein [Desulfofundulus thermosubterraneus]|uniref:Metal dependent phosphohydrolase n=1 Tax=Desulfofundulus thermosubterraneus DSM 16057 TaxID=1121432 RepID=A0A1M6JSL6_9FIRM|nr:HD-GYP domain-containing protein [Desulfofundulus thermosubterraneus]SHJ49661.1 metal dependent phosphohydrolase [Desulfofundulus thermosubterraneus DSM 16057]
MLILKSRFDQIYHDAVECLVAALEARDPYSCGHSRRVADMAVDLARLVGLKGRELEMVHIAAHLHDIGKIGVPDQILRKPGRLLSHEYAIIQRHPEIGYNILVKSRQLKRVAVMVLHHHERWDGKGYPRGLKGEAIPLGSRIIALCDTVDAMTSERPYRPPLSWQQCRQEIVAGKAGQFDAVLVEAAEKLWPVWERRYCYAV